MASLPLYQNQFCGDHMLSALAPIYMPTVVAVNEKFSVTIRRMVKGRDREATYDVSQDVYATLKKGDFFSVIKNGEKYY
jgi:nitrogen fixation protein FixH